MTPTPVSTPNEGEEQQFQTTAQLAHTLLRLVLAVRYRKNLVVVVMVAAALLGALFFATATRRYAAKAGLLITQTGHDRLDTSIANEDLQRQNTMPTFENMIRSAKVLEGAMTNLSPADRLDLAGVPQRMLDRCPAEEPGRQGGSIHQHLAGRISLEEPASGGERGAGGGAIVPRLHGPHAQGNGRRPEPDADP